MIHKKLILLIIFGNLSYWNLCFAQKVNKDSVTHIKEQEAILPGYVKYPEWMVTSAISSISGNELFSSFVNSVGNSLHGKVPGLSVRQKNNEPGMNFPTLNIRGRSTFNSGYQPLIIVDGFEGSINRLVPQEIESIEVLKDAAATAIYGSRGANGVILINTKRGKIEPVKVNFSVRQGIQQTMRLPKFLGSYNYAKLYNEALRNDGFPKEFSSQEIELYKNKNDKFFLPNVNWYEQVIRKSIPISDYNLNFSGGDSTVRYFGLLNVLRNGGIFKKVHNLSGEASSGSFTQYNFRSNIDVNITKNLLASLNLGGSVSDRVVLGGQDRSDFFDLISTIPPNTFPIFNPNGTLGGSSTFDNPIGVLKSNYFTSNDRTLLVSLGLKQQLNWITPGLSVSGAVSFNNYFAGYSIKDKDYLRYSVKKASNGDTLYHSYGKASSVNNNEGESDRWHSTSVKISLNYQRKFKAHDIEAMLVSKIENRQLLSDLFPYKHALLGGRFNYVLKDRYVGNISFSYSGTNNFYKGKRFGFFPAISIGWILSKERFLGLNRFFDYLKLRGSFGLTGNDNIGGERRFLFDEFYYRSGLYYFGTSNSSFNALVKSSLPNNDVSMERQKQLNIGIDGILFKHIGFHLDLFKQRRYDILTSPDRTIPYFSGILLPGLNVGKVENKGFEASVNYSNNTNKFIYIIGLNVWYAKNKIIYNDESLKVEDYLYTTGHQIGQPFVLKAIGFFESKSDIKESPDQYFGEVQPGDLKYKDQNGDGIVNQNDRYPIGNSDLGKLNGALSIGLQYNKFKLSLLIQGVSGRTVYISGKDFYAFQNNGKISRIALGRWTPTTLNNATYPRLSSEDNRNNYGISSSFWQRDGGYLKLRSLEVGYELSNKFLKKVGIQRGEIFINGVNIFSLDHMNGLLDPEISEGGYPSMRTLNLGIDIKF